MLLFRMTKKKQAASPDKVKQMLVNVILDRSGSMGSIRQPTIDGYNEYLNGLRKDKDGEYYVTLLQFDTGGPDAQGMLTVSYVENPLAEVPDLTPATYEPRGGTPLFDAIGECIRRVDAKGRAVFTVIITDGEENSSREFTREAVKALITSKEAEGWKFVFLGANIDAAKVGGSMGIGGQSCASYVATTAGVTNTFAAASASNLRYSMDTRAYGVGSPIAKAAAHFNEQERSAMLGGRPAAPQSFPAGKAVAGGGKRKRTRTEQPVPSAK